MTDHVKVNVRRSGRSLEAEAVLDLAANAQTVWDTITDYGALPSFMPGIRACRVIERRTPTKRLSIWRSSSTASSVSCYSPRR